MIKQLIKLANHLDKKGFTKEADYLDLVISRYMGAEKKISQTETKSETYYFAIFNRSKNCIIECFDYVTEDKDEIDNLNSIMSKTKGYPAYIYAEKIDKLSSFPSEVSQKVKKYINELGPQKIDAGISIFGCESFNFAENCK